jgi:hypothetical protein
VLPATALATSFTRTTQMGLSCAASAARPSGRWSSRNCTSALRVTSRQPPHAFEWWERSLRQDDPVEEIRRLRRQLGFAIADAGKRPPLLRALGRETDVQLQQLAGRATFGVGELASELRERCQLLEKTVDHFCDVAAGW